MAPKNSKTAAPDKLALFDKLVATNPDIERKGDTNPYTSLNGNMFTHMTPEGELAIRLSEEDRLIFIKKYKARFQEIYGIIRKEYVVVPDSLLSDTKELKPWFDLSYSYAKTLKPKATKK